MALKLNEYAERGNNLQYRRKPGYFLKFNGQGNSLLKFLL